MTNVYLVTKLILSIVIIGNCIMFGMYLEVRDKLRELRSLEETVISKLRLMEDEKEEEEEK